MYFTQKAALRLLKRCDSTRHDDVGVFPGCPPPPHNISWLISWVYFLQVLYSYQHSLHLTYFGYITKKVWGLILSLISDINNQIACAVWVAGWAWTTGPWRILWPGRDVRSTASIQAWSSPTCSGTTCGSIGSPWTGGIPTRPSSPSVSTPAPRNWPPSWMTLGTDRWEVERRWELYRTWPLLVV